MKATFGIEGTCDAWKVTRAETPEAWVQELLDEGKLVWKKDVVGVFIGPTASIGKAGVVTQVILGKTGGGSFATPVKAYVGQWLILNANGEFRGISEKEFKKVYHLV